MKRPFTLFMAVLSFMLIAKISFAQLNELVPSTDVKAVECVIVNFSDIVKYDLEHPNQKRAKRTKIEKHVPESKFVDKSKVIFMEPARESSDLKSLNTTTSPAPDANFAGLADNSTFIPPDVTAAVGPSHIMQTLNTEVRITNKTGTQTSKVTLNSFCSSVMTATLNTVCDPRIFYDRQAGGRWIFACILFNGTNPFQQDGSYFVVGVSYTSDPTGTWKLYKWHGGDYSGTGDYLFDFPSVGFNKNWVVVTGNLFNSSSAFKVEAVYAINKSELFAHGASTPTAKKFSINAPTQAGAFYTYTLVPPVMADTNATEMNLYSCVAGLATDGNGYFSQYKLYGAVGSEQLAFQGYIGTANPWNPGIAASDGNCLPQQGSTTKIHGGDDRITGAYNRNGTTYLAHTIFLPASATEDATKVAVQWWEINQNGVILQRSRIEDESATHTKHYAYPSIAVNANQEVLIGYSTFADNQYASSAYSLRLKNDPLNTLQNPYTYKAGQSAYTQTGTGDPRVRWGDYSGVLIDPSNDLDFFTIQEYAKTSGQWATHFAKLVRPATANGITSDFVALNNVVIPVGGSVAFLNRSTVKGGSGTTFYNWTYEGGTPSTQSLSSIISGSPITSYDHVGTYDVTLRVSKTGLTADTIKKSDYITVIPNRSAWIEQASGFDTISRGIMDIDIVDSNVVWAIAYNGVYSGTGTSRSVSGTKTTNGGKTWVPFTVNNVPNNLSIANISAISKDTAWVLAYPMSGSGGRVYKTINGGTTWTNKSPAAPDTFKLFADFVHFWNKNDGVAVGDVNAGEFEIFKTSNGGNTWARVAAGNIPNPITNEGGAWTNGYEAYGTGTLWFGTNRGRLYKTTDKGATWTASAVHVGSLQDVAEQIAFLTADTGLVLLTRNITNNTMDSLKVTYNGGTTWKKVAFTGKMYFGELAALRGRPKTFVSTSPDASVITKCGSSISTDYGLTWQMIDDSIQYTSSAFLNYRIGFAGGFNANPSQGGMYKWTGLPKADFTSNKNWVGQGQTVTFTDQSSYPALNVSRSWAFAGGTPATSTAANPVITYNTMGDYQVSLTISNILGSNVETKAAYIHVGSVAIEDINVEAENGSINVYPNPTTGNLNVDFGSEASKAKYVEVYNVVGKLITKVDVALITKQIVELNLAKQPAGMYYVTVKTSDNSITKKVFLIK